MVLGNLSMQSSYFFVVCSPPNFFTPASTANYTIFRIWHFSDDTVFKMKQPGRSYNIDCLNSRNLRNFVGTTGTLY